MPSEDPLAEFDDLTSQLASLEKKFVAREVPKEQFELLSRQLKERIANAESLAYLTARKNKSLAKRLRMRNYTDPTVQQVCSHFIYGFGEPLQPKFGADRVPRYVAEPEKGHPVAVDHESLQRIAGIGMLAETLFEKLIFCPKCSSPSDVYNRFKCTQCSSIDITMSRMIEHLYCGTIHQEAAFRVGSSMICPTCKKLIQRTEEYRLIGVVCTCKACGAHFGEPVQTFHCRRCEFDFNLPTATVVDAFTYTMSPDALHEARSHLGIPALAKILQEGGFEVATPGVLTSPSGENFEFSIIARKESKVVAVELAQSSSDVEVEPVLEMYVKLMETRPTLAVLGVVPGLSRKGRGVASMHDIQIAEGPNALEVGRKILEIASAK